MKEHVVLMTVVIRYDVFISYLRHGTLFEAAKKAPTTSILNCRLKQIATHATKYTINTSLTISLRAGIPRYATII